MVSCIIGTGYIDGAIISFDISQICRLTSQIDVSSRVNYTARNDCGLNGEYEGDRVLRF